MTTMYTDYAPDFGLDLILATKFVHDHYIYAAKDMRGNAFALELDSDVTRGHILKAGAEYRGLRKARKFFHALINKT